MRSVKLFLLLLISVFFCSVGLLQAQQSALRFVPLSPCRVADTRVSGPAISPHSSRDFTVGGTCGIPLAAAAFSLNVTAIPPGILGYISVWPKGQPQPLVSTLNSLDGRIKANAAIVPAGTDGMISIYSTDNTDIVLDVNGYFVDVNTNPNALAFFKLPPCRVADTRNSTAALGGPALVAAQARSLPVLSSNCNIPATAQAYSLNMTVAPHRLLGYLSTWPTGVPQPFVSTLNALTGTLTANAAIVPAGINGAISVYATDDTDLIVDINGYFAPSTSASDLSLYTLPPCRVLDTRVTPGAFQGSMNPPEDTSASACGIIPNAEAVVLNATVLPAHTLGYLALWPGSESQPFVSTLNALDGYLTSNMAIVPTTQGVINAYVTDTTHLILDTTGYFAGGTNPAPVVTTVNPTTVNVTDRKVSVSVNGSGFVPYSVARWNGAARTTAFISSTILQMTLSAADVSAAGTGLITVVNPAPGGGTSSAVALDIDYAVPVVTTLSPNTAVMGSPMTTINVYGSGFAPASVVQWGGTALVTAYVSSGQIRALVPAGDLAINGTASITVVNPAPGGGTSAPATFTISAYPVPAITAVTPTSLVVNSPNTSIIVNGSGFQNVSTIQVNGNDLPTSFVATYSGGYLTAILPSSYLTTLRSLQITVYTPPPSGGTSAPVYITVIAPAAPTLSGINPSSAAIGTGDLTLTVSGSNFVPTSVVRWNGSNRPTTYVSMYQLTAQISAADLAVFTQAQISVYTPPPGGGSTTTSTFNTYLALATNSMVYNPTDQRLFASVPSSAGASLGNSIVPIDPNTGVVGTPIFVGSEPNKLALSSDGSTLWVGLDGAGAVRQVNLKTRTAGLQFGLGGGVGIYNGPNTAVSIAVMPGFPDTIAVAASHSGWGTGAVTIYDSGVSRPSNSGSILAVNSVAFSSSGNTLYAVGNGYEVLSVDNTGIASSVVKNSSVSGNALVYDSGKVYLNTGVVLDAETGVQLGVFSVSPTQQANGPLALDSAVGRAFILVNSNYLSNYQINAYDLTTYVLAGNVPIGPISSVNAYVAELVRCGQDALAYRSSTQVVVLHSPLVHNLSTSLADLSTSVPVPPATTTGSDVTYSVTVSNKGPVTASPAVLMDRLPDGAILKSITASQGTCSGSVVISCNLGDLAASATASVQITATVLAPGTATNIASASAPQGDPDLGNNTATSATVISGSAYSAMPSLASLSPAIIAAGSAGFTLTANGSGFVAGSTLNWNGVALATSYVSSSQLTAQVDAAKVANFGWAWVSVTNPAPGGGTTSPLAFTMYLALNLSSNHILFDPFSRKIYATIPSTATQVAGNSVVAIDPFTGTWSSPLFVGSEPNHLAESKDGKYLYVGLDGSKSLARIDVGQMTLGNVYPLSLASSGPVTVRSLDVMPGNDNTLVIDTGAWTGIGVFDISGTTGAFREKVTGPYTGSNLTFANASTVYSYDSDTSGGTFNRWTVGSNGLNAIDQSTLFGMGGFLGRFQVKDGLIYGLGGGVADPRATPPSQIGRYMVSNYGLYQSLTASSVAADPASNRVFFTGSSTAGSALPYLVSFDWSRFTVVDIFQFPGYELTGIDLQHWGRDGLAWVMSSWPYGGNSSTVILMRGPRVLPQWGMDNPVATAASTSPANAVAGTGNLIVTVSGLNFVPGAVVLWNGAERTTTFIDASHLEVAVPASDVAITGTATLTVVNPGAAVSPGITFTIN